MLRLVNFVLFLTAVMSTSGRSLKKKRYLGSQIDPYPFCGYRFLDKNVKDVSELFDQLKKRIVGGEESVQGSWPWQVALLLNGTQFCAGSLINRRWIVTAGHCFHDAYSSTNPQHWSATLGEHKLVDKEEFEQVRGIESITIHPKYVLPYFQGIYDAPPDYDIAVIKLSSPAEITENVQPICLFRPGQEFKPGKKCYVIGWGHTQFTGSQPPALREAKVKLVSSQTCNKNISYGGKIHERALCAGFEKGGVDACQYDSGGSLGCEQDGRYFLTGIVSWGHECARPHKYGVYTNMAVLTRWVFEIISQLDGNGSQL